MVDPLGVEPRPCELKARHAIRYTRDPEDPTPLLPLGALTLGREPARGMTPRHRSSVCCGSLDSNQDCHGL